MAFVGPGKFGNVALIPPVSRHLALYCFSHTWIRVGLHLRNTLKMLHNNNLIHVIAARTCDAHLKRYVYLDRVMSALRI